MSENKMKQVYKMHEPDKEYIRANVLNGVGDRHATTYKRLKLKPIVAVCMTLLIFSVSFGAYAVIAEAKEYEAAVEFFDEYSLSSEGLTRSEIKAVYKDITMKIYSYEKTIEILNEFSVEMYSTKLDTVDSDSLDALWNVRNENLRSDGTRKNRSDVWYDVVYTTDEEDVTTDQIKIIKYNGESEAWSYTVPYEMYIFMSDNIFVCDEGLIVYGQKRDDKCACVFMLDNSGKRVWEHCDTSAESEFDTAIKSDNEIVLLGREGRRGYNLFTVLNMNGEMQKRSTIINDEYTLYDTVVKINDFYLVKQYSGSGYPENSELVSISEDGEQINKFTYSDNGTTYQIEDIIYCDGRVYLSALLPNITNKKFDKKFQELMNEYYECWIDANPEAAETMQDLTMPEEYNIKLRKLFQNEYAAVLLVCDDEAVITKAYSVENSRAGTLSINDDESLAWQVMRIDDVKNAPPNISSHRVSILATEFSFVFDSTGKLAEKHEIGVNTIWE